MLSLISNGVGYNIQQTIMSLRDTKYNLFLENQLQLICVLLLSSISCRLESLYEYFIIQEYYDVKGCEH